MLITFDLDGVLQVNPFRKGVFPEVCRKVGESLTQKQNMKLADAARMVMKMIADESRSRLKEGNWVEAYDWDDIVNIVAKKCHTPLHFDIEALVVKYCTPEYISAYPHAREVLKKLEASDTHLAVVTNGYCKYQHPVMQALGLRDFFSEFITPDLYGVVKPDPAIFQIAVDSCGTGCSPYLHVGDTIIHDVYGARAAGIDPVWVHTRLPVSLRSLSPWERAASPDLRPLQKEAFQSDFCPDAYPHIDWSDCQPTYVIQDLRELPAVVRHAEEKAA